MIYSLFESCIVILTTIFVNLVQFMVLQRGFKKKLKKFHFLPRYRRWNLQFGKKLRPRKFKSSISQNHVFEQKSRQESARNTKFGQVGVKQSQNKIWDLLFQKFAFFQNKNLIFFTKNALKMRKNIFSCIKHFSQIEFIGLCTKIKSKMAYLD